MAQRIMSMVSKKPTLSGLDDTLSPGMQQDKIDEVRRQIGPQSGKLSLHCSDASISRYLRTWNWDVNKAAKMLKATLKWRLGYKPDEILWKDVAKEAETGKIYLASYKDEHGRPVLVMRPRCQNTKSIKGQVKYLVYCIEKAIQDLPDDDREEEIVWLVDFHGLNMSNLSITAAREVIYILRDHYPQRIGVALFYDPPKIFEPFWKVVRSFCDAKTTERVKFVYSNDLIPGIMNEIFEVEALESAFGGKNGADFEYERYAERMRDYDRRAALSKTEADEEEDCAQKVALPPLPPSLLVPITAT